MSTTERIRATVDAATDRPTLVAFVRLSLITLGLGAIAGMGTFMFTNRTLIPHGLPHWTAMGLVVLAGLLTVPLVPPLRRNFVISFLAIFVAFVVHAGTWVSPLYVAGYPTAALQVLVPKYAGQALLSAWFLLPLAYYSGYFTVLLVYSYVVMD